MHVMLIDSSDVLSQLRGEWLHAAFVAVFGGIAYYVKRDLRLRATRLDKIEICLKEHDGEIASLHRQTRDTRAAVACCETELDIQHYPYVD